VVTGGVIEHLFEPRRATLYANRILSISGWELLSVDATDRDHPLVRSTTALAWPVDRVFLHGDFVLELGGTGGWGWGGWWGNTGNSMRRVAPAAAPDRIVRQLELSRVPVLGATRARAHLCLGHWEPVSVYPP